MKIIRELIGDTVKEFFHDREVRKEIRKFIPAFIGGDTIPTPVGNDGKVLSSNGTSMTWEATTNIYTGDGSLSGDREIDLNGHELEFSVNDQAWWYAKPDLFYQEFLASNGLVGDPGVAYSRVSLKADGADPTVYLDLFTTDGTNQVQINLNPPDNKISLTANTGTIQYTADTHTFNGNFKSGTDNEWDLNGHELRFEETSGSYLQISPIPTEEVIRLRSFSSQTNTDTYLHLNSSSDVGWGFELEADKLGDVVSIEGDAAAKTIEYTADTHTFNIVTGGLFVVKSGDTFAITSDGDGGAASLNAITGTNSASLGCQTNLGNDTASFTFLSSYNNGANSSSITSVTSSTSAHITYTADLHTINGVINLPTRSAPVSPNDGDIWRQDNTNTGLKIRIAGLTKTINVS